MNRTASTLLCSIFYLMGDFLFAQNARFVTSGAIEYEKSINMHAQIRKSMNSDNYDFYLKKLEEFKKTEPQFKLLKSTLIFSKERALFAPYKTEKEVVKEFDNLPEVKQVNIVFSDFKTRESTVQKDFYDEIFLLKKTIRPIQWKVTSETREIAGFECRRANAIIMDSIYVVAFYAYQIPVSSGPESFSGLPGMILGVVLPHQNISWFATSVLDKPVSGNLLSAPSKGKPLTDKDLVNKLKSTRSGGGFSTFEQRKLLFFSL